MVRASRPRAMLGTFPLAVTASVTHVVQTISIVLLAQRRAPFVVLVTIQRAGQMLRAPRANRTREHVTTGSSSIRLSAHSTIIAAHARRDTFWRTKRANNGLGTVPTARLSNRRSALSTGTAVLVTRDTSWRVMHAIHGLENVPTGRSSSRRNELRITTVVHAS